MLHGERFNPVRDDVALTAISCSLNRADMSHDQSEFAARRGAILVLAALCLIMVFAFVAFSVDIGYICFVDAQLQNAADAAALAGAQSLPDGAVVSRTAAIAVAASNLAASVPVQILTQDIELGSWDEDEAAFSLLTGTLEVNANAVRVTCRRSSASGNSLNLFFAKMLGVPDADVSAQAIALAKMPRCSRIIGIDSVNMGSSSRTDSYSSSGARYRRGIAGSNGHVCSNGNMGLTGHARINGDAHPGPGKRLTRSGSSVVTGAVDPLTKPMTFAAIDTGDAATVNDNRHIPLSEHGVQPLDARGQFSLSSGDRLDLLPGTYYFSALTVSGSATLTISGPTRIYVTGDVDLSGGSAVNSTRIPSNLQLYPMGSRCDVSGSADLYAVVYGPGTSLIKGGSADYYGMLLGRDLTLTGTGGVHADESVNVLLGNRTTSSLVH